MRLILNNQLSHESLWKIYPSGQSVVWTNMSCIFTFRNQLGFKVQKELLLDEYSLWVLSNFHRLSKSGAKSRRRTNQGQHDAVEILNVIGWDQMQQRIPSILFLVQLWNSWIFTVFGSQIWSKLIARLFLPFTPQLLRC